MTCTCTYINGANDYQGWYYGTPVPPPPTGEISSPRSDLVRFFSSVKAEHKQTVDDGQSFARNFPVSADTPAFNCAALTDSGTFPAGATIQIARPDGSWVTKGSLLSNEYATFDHQGNLTSFVAANPGKTGNFVGSWTFDVAFPDGATDAHFMISTVPSANADQTMVNTLTPLLDPAQIPTEFADAVSTSCWVCRVGLIALAVIIAAVIAFGGAIVVAEFPPVLALAAYIGTSVAWATSIAVALGITVASLAMAIIKTMIALAGAAVGALASTLCFFLSSCAEAVSVALTSPATGAKVKGVVPITTTLGGEAIKLEFFIDGNLKNTVTAPFNISWDTTRNANGPHTLTLIAYTASGTSGLSIPVGVNVQN